RRLGHTRAICDVAVVAGIAVRVVAARCGASTIVGTRVGATRHSGTSTHASSNVAGSHGSIAATAASGVATDTLGTRAARALRTSLASGRIRLETSAVNATGAGSTGFSAATAVLIVGVGIGADAATLRLT